MHNWSVDTKELEKDPEKFTIWRLEQMINYGEPGEKLDEETVRKYWHTIRDRIDPGYKAFLEFLLWPETKKQVS